MPLHQLEHLEDCGGLALEQVFVACFQQLMMDVEAIVQRPHRLLGLREHARAQVLQNDLVQLHHRARIAVVALHELLAGPARSRIGQSVLLRHRRLQIEHQPVLAPPGLIVEADAQILQQALVPADASCLLRRDDGVVRQVAPAAADAAGARDPQDIGEIAQSARALLDVGLEIVGSVVEAVVPLLLLEQLGFEECARVERLSDRVLEALRQCAASDHPARFQQVGLHRDVLAAFGDALRYGAHAVPQLQPDVPQLAHQVGDQLARRRCRPRPAAG